MNSDHHHWQKSSNGYAEMEVQESLTCRTMKPNRSPSKGDKSLFALDSIRKRTIEGSGVQANDFSYISPASSASRDILSSSKSQSSTKALPRRSGRRHDTVFPETSARIKFAWDSGHEGTVDVYKVDDDLSSISGASVFSRDIACQPSMPYPNSFSRTNEPSFHHQINTTRTSSNQYPQRQLSGSTLAYTASSSSSIFDLYSEWRNEYETHNPHASKLTYRNHRQHSQATTQYGQKRRENKSIETHLMPTFEREYSDYNFYHDKQQAQHQKQQLPFTIIEIAPGLEARLRGSKETWAAVRHNFISSTHCLCCDDLIHCIRDADFVLCPNCRVVNPMHDVESSIPKDEPSNERLISVGLGMRDNDLRKWREECGLAKK